MAGYQATKYGQIQKTALSEFLTYVELTNVQKGNKHLKTQVQRKLWQLASSTHLYKNV